MNPPADDRSAGAGVHLDNADAGEELARAELYGLLSRLWIGPPDEALLEQFSVAVTQAPEDGGFLEMPWQALVSAMRETDVATATDEYDTLFMGLGRSEVMLYGSYYLAGYLNEKPLAALRGDLARLGLARDETRAETEDHIAHGLEVMRYLIAGEDVGVCNLEQQRRFFRDHLQPWVGRLCEAVAAHHQARLYKAVAALTEAFIVVETQAFDMIE
jgi:TorA maturation chaperone TorD